MQPQRDPAAYRAAKKRKEYEVRTAAIAEVRETRRCYEEHKPPQIRFAHRDSKGGTGMIACSVNTIDVLPRRKP